MKYINQDVDWKVKREGRGGSGSKSLRIEFII